MIVMFEAVWLLYPDRIPDTKADKKRRDRSRDRDEQQLCITPSASLLLGFSLQSLCLRRAYDLRLAVCAHHEFPKTRESLCDAIYANCDAVLSSLMNHTFKL